MKSLTQPPKTYILEASLETLHEQSVNWLNTIKLWEDEGQFYLDFLENKLFNQITSEDKSRIEEILHEVIGNNTEAFKTELSVHERELNRIIEGELDARDFRLRHTGMVHRFVEFETQLKLFKKSVLELSKLVNQNFFNANETLNIISERRSVRKFTGDSVEKKHVQQIIEAGTMAPSAMNKQPWKFYVVNNKEKIKLLSDEIRKVAETILHLDLKAFQKETDPVFHGAPIVIFISTTIKDEWGPIDVGMCAQNMMLAAKSLGYDSCPIGFARAIEKSLVYYDMHIPKEEKIQLAIVIGKGNEKPVMPKRNADNINYIR